MCFGKMRNGANLLDKKKNPPTCLLMATDGFIFFKWWS